MILKPMIRMLCAGLVASVLCGCAGAYVAGDVGAHQDADHSAGR